MGEQKGNDLTRPASNSEPLLWPMQASRRPTTRTSLTSTSTRSWLGTTPQTGHKQGGGQFLGCSAFPPPAAAASRVYVDALSRLARQAQLGTWGGSKDVVLSTIEKGKIITACMVTGESALR
ncbi:brain-specific angiogenesis inhibitor 1-associated protein 2-like [Vespula maculifrons]|uniref:Brain-specific angiogenesis inhibitor 1-associated protein 2-like n=1 Tax=Vespula maculifrons TaxID=7453 RepID=A0ABD2BK34_VESMC